MRGGKDDILHAILCNIFCVIQQKISCFIMYLFIY